MPVEFKKRDYSLTGPENARAIATGLANASWYRTEIPRARMKALLLTPGVEDSSSANQGFTLPPYAVYVGQIDN